MPDFSSISLASTVAPLATYAVVFQTLVYVSLPRSLRTRLAPVVTGLIGATIAVAAAFIFGFDTVGLAGGLFHALVWGGVTLLVMFGVGSLMLSRPDLKAHLAGQPLALLDRRRAVGEIAVRIPIFTALIEEAFFRGVLHAALMALYPMEVAVWLGAGLFGLWHIGPGIDQTRNGDHSMQSRAVHTAVTVVATTLAGVFLVWLRIETGSIWAPVTVHATINMTLAGFVRVAAARSRPAA